MTWDSLVIAGALLAVGVALYYLWLNYHHKKS